MRPATILRQPEVAAKTGPCICLQVNVMVECAFVKDVLKGDDAYELRLKFLVQAAETYPYRDED